jgi:hypothetical protein
MPVVLVTVTPDQQSDHNHRADEPAGQQDESPAGGEFTGEFQDNEQRLHTQDRHREKNGQQVLHGG